MSDVHAAQDIPHDGTISGAVDTMPDIDNLERANGDRAESRDDLGRFKAAQEEAGSDGAPEPDKNEGDDAAPDQAAETDDDEDYLEWELPGENEGDEPKIERVKASEAIESLQRAKQLEAELENVKATAPPPPDYDRAIMESVQAGTQYLQGLQQLEIMLQPIAPNQDLINPNSPNYDPETYSEQLQHAQAQQAQFANVQAERQRVEAQNDQQQEALGWAQFAREQQKLMEMWPEVKEEATADKVRQDASRHYGIDEQTMNSVHDARFYAILKDALAYREQSAAKETAVKVVKAKPKLVKGKARQGNPANRRSAEGMQRLQQTGSLDDATNALEGLI